MDNFSKLEDDLWEAADQLRANGNVPYNEFFMPVMGIIFLRHAANRYEAVDKQIQAERASGQMKRAPIAADYRKRRALYLPEVARYEHILGRAKDTHLGEAVDDAMTAMENEFSPLKGVVPKDYIKFDAKLLEDLMKIFNRETLKQAKGDIFGRIYEYFLLKFSMEKAHDNGEFFTPPSLVQTLVNVIEPGQAAPHAPKRGNIVLDLACGSGGMFVQTSHFIEMLGFDTAHRVTFYGQEKTATTIRLAKMNLAVHGLEGDIKEANTYYQDEHSLVGKADFVMANPPFNVDMIDATKAEKDTRRLPFGLPGVNKEKKVSNGNYIWISYFWSYLNPKGRAGFVMSSQASSAGNDEKEVRRKIVETGDVDVMISIRGGFFYTRTVPCELWHFDRNKPADRTDKVLMLDARSIGQLMKGSRKVYEFTPEQTRNLSAIVWLYRGQRDRYLKLVQDYFQQHAAQCVAVSGKVTAFDTGLKALDFDFDAIAKAVKTVTGLDAEKSKLVAETLAELRVAAKAYATDRAKLLDDLAAFVKSHGKNPPATNDKQHAARKAFDPVAERIKGLIKQVDSLYKLASRITSTAAALAANEDVAALYDRREASKHIKALDEQRHAAVEQLKHAAYFHRQIVWLQDRFPKAEMQPVPGLVKVVTRKEIAVADWSLTPGRYVGVAPAEVDDDFDFEQSITDIHNQFAVLNKEATALANTILKNFEELGV